MYCIYKCGHHLTKVQFLKFSALVLKTINVLICLSKTSMDHSLFFDCKLCLLN